MKGNPSLPRGRVRTVLAAFSLAAVTGLSTSPASAQALSTACGLLGNPYGPFDYRTDGDKLPIVENAHFTPEVELLVRGKSGRIGGDIDYTLRAFPNHHRALVAMMRFAEVMKVDPVPDANYTVQCYFARALHFRPDDTTVRMLYAVWLNGRQRRDEALGQLALGKVFAGENAFTHYNLGLVYMDLGEHESALQQAHTAMRLGFQRTELKQRLQAVNRWREPEATPPAAAASQP